jgi:predicted PurR-regulated permease PerM
MPMSTPTHPRQTHDTDSLAVLAKWVRRCGLPFAILAWTGVALLILWLAGQVIQTLLLLALAAVLAYALAPAVTLLARVMPRFLAILVVYLVVLGLIGALLYLIVRTAIGQFVSLAGYVRFLLTPSTSGQLTPLDQAMQSVGISPSQIASARDQIVASLESFAGSVVPLLTGLVGVLLDVILVAVLSIYLLADGARVAAWLRQNMPERQQGGMRFLLDTLQRVVGGYIRGQVLLCGLLGLMVGVGWRSSACRMRCCWGCWHSSSGSFRSLACSFQAHSVYCSPCRRAG